MTEEDLRDVRVYIFPAICGNGSHAAGWFNLKQATFPSFEKEGWTRQQTKYREATFEGADGREARAR